MARREAALGTTGHPLRVVVVGAGPSGFYAAEALLECGIAVEIDMLERLPVPYGLVRYGVAPDHPKLKSVTTTFAQIAQDARMRFFGNVAVGRDIDAAGLGSMYHAVIVATGADTDRKLGIEGEDLPGVHAASAFVGWYNGAPACAGMSFDHSQEVVVIVGQGNVAIDVCRILAKPIDELRCTDMAQHAIDALASSRAREIHLVGRRGPVQARFTPKELRELGALVGWQPVVDAADLELNDASRAELMHPDFVHAAKNLEILRGFATRPRSAQRTIHLHFHRMPTALCGLGRLQQVSLQTQRLEGPPAAQVAVPAGDFDSIDAGLLFKSVGYLGSPLPGIPFDAGRGVLRHREGRLQSVAGECLQGWYATGWIKRGATGVIGSNRADSIETVARLLQDLPLLDAPRPGRSALQAALHAKRHQVVTFEGWLAVERAERQRGLLAGKTAEKFVCVADMLAAAQGHAA